MVALIAVALTAAFSGKRGFAGVQLFEVTSGSMNPAISTGSLIATYPVTQYVPGDIVSFGVNNSQTIVTHRIIESQSGGFVTKGDANDDSDRELLKEQAIIGKVVFVLPFAGYITAFLRTPAGYVLCIVLPAAALIFWGLYEGIGIKTKSK